MAVNTSSHSANGPSRFPNRRRALFVMVVCLQVTAVGTTTIGIYQISRLGEKVNAIAQAYIPISETISGLAILQLEQELLLERSIQHSGSDTGARLLNDYERIFRETGRKGQEKFSYGINLAAGAIAVPYFDVYRVDFKNTLVILRNLERQYGVFANHGAEIMRLLRAGHSATAIPRIDDAERESRVIRRNLGLLLEEFEAFTQAAASKAVTQEKSAFTFMVVLTGIGALVGLLCGLTIVRMTLARPPQAVG